MPARQRRSQYRFGIGEWYGKSFIHLSAGQRKKYAMLQTVPRPARQPQLCPFQSRPNDRVNCNKEGGVCSLRLYTRKSETEDVTTAEPPRDRLRCTCPNRFKENGAIYKWVAKTILGNDRPTILKEIPFLESTIPQEEEGGQAPGEVGLIDNILVIPDSNPVRWCALEVQAVYFSGAAMKKDFEAIVASEGQGIPFPAGNRHPDYRSSAPKRLMPQLQIKVPSLRRWGKKMAVVVDQDFFRNMGPMQTVRDVSNCDVAWFIVRFDESREDAKLVPHEVKFTTLEHSVEGLTAGIPVSLETFEQRIRDRMA